MKIVVGVDGSEESNRAVEWCAEYAGALGAEVIAIHAIDIPLIVAPASTAFPLRIPQLSAEDRDGLLEVATNNWCAPLAKVTVPFRVVLKDGDPALEIMQVAKAENADLVVTGRRGRGGFAELVLGSTTYALVHHLNRPLVIVP